MSNGLILHGADGNLVLVRLGVDARLLEEVLEALAGASFPINPEIRHGHPYTWVEFPAYEKHVAEIRRLLQTAGIRDVQVDLTNMLIATL